MAKRRLANVRNADPSPAAAAMTDRQETEADISRQVRDVLARSLSPGYLVHVGKSILYKIEVNALGQVEPNSVDSPTRGQYAFQTDILIEKHAPSIPLVVIELKSGGFSTHDVITYSSKAARHKDIYPYLRYGFVVVGLSVLSRKFVTHNQGFDFAMALPDVSSQEADLVAVIQKQIASAECLIGIMRSNRVKFSRYEETIHVSD
jgi:hypothetical protein